MSRTRMMSVPSSLATHTSGVSMPTSSPGSLFHLADPRSLAHGVQVAQGLRVGVYEAGLTVGQFLLSAEFPDQRLGSAQVRARHGGKPVVLDLVVDGTFG